MKNRAKLKLNNRGAGIVTVLVAIMFLTAFGSVLLMLSYTGLEMRASDRKGKENLYDASSIMEEINVGVQEICSEAIVASYSDTLIRYNDFGTNVTKAFQENYRDFIEKCYFNTTTEKWEKIPSSGATGGRLIYTLDGNLVYDISVLEDMIVGREVDETGNPVSDAEGNHLYKGGSYKIYAIDENNNKLVNANTGKPYGKVDGFSSAIELNKKPKDLKLKGVCVEYTNAGRTTRVSADITIQYPNIGYSNNTYKDSGINQHACIVEGSLIQHGDGTSCAVLGSAYFGAVQLDGAAQMVFSKHDTPDSRFVIGTGIEINGNAQSIHTGGMFSDHTEYNGMRFVVGDGSELWTEGVTVNTSSSTLLTGKTYIANDLLLKGNNSKAVLAGEYFGMGNSLEDSAMSSSIIANGRNTQLDITNLNTLTLAGYAFIGNTNYYQTTESMSSKENQRVYLLPENVVTYDYVLNGNTITGNSITSNPQVMTKERFNSITAWHVSNEPFGWTDSSAKPGDYGITEPTIVVENTGSEQYIVYAFAKFGATEGQTANDNANRFFKDYFKKNSRTIQNYLRNYITITGKANTYQTMGPTFYNAEGTKVELSDYLDPVEAVKLSSEAATYLDSYERLRTSLNQVEEYEDEDNPLNYILSENLDDIVNDYITYQVDNNGSPLTVAIASNKDIEITVVNKGTTNATKVIKVDGNIVPGANPDNVCMIITTGKITVDSVAYNGLLVTKSDLELKGGAILNRDPANVTAALVAKDSSGGTISDFLDNENSEEEKMGNEWKVTTLVTYDNWKRTIED